VASYFRDMRMVQRPSHEAENGAGHSGDLMFGGAAPRYKCICSQELQRPLLITWPCLAPFTGASYLVILFAFGDSPGLGILVAGLLKSKHSKNNDQAFYACKHSIFSGFWGLVSRLNL